MSETFYLSKILFSWKKNTGEDWVRYTQHDFVKGLSDGSLPKRSFKKYLIQDYIFLTHFTRAWALAVVKSETIDEMKLAASTVNALINYEMQLHIDTCKKIGISEEELFETEEAFENLSYTRFVMDSGFSGDFVDLMAALSPCIFGYGEIGKNLSRLSVPNNPYRNWIDAYSGDEYQNLCNSLGQLIESSTLKRIGPVPGENPRWRTLCKRFHVATKLEINFWTMGLRAVNENQNF